MEQKSAKLLSNLHVSWFITMVELGGVLFCVCVWRISRNGWNLFQRNASVQTYLLLAGCTSVKRGLANIALLVKKYFFLFHFILAQAKLPSRVETKPCRIELPNSAQSFRLGTRKLNEKFFKCHDDDGPQKL